jgi:carboxyl-terminal processing protease
MSERKFPSFRTCVAGLAIAIALSWVWSYELQEVSAREKSQSDLFDELRVFTDVLAIVQRDYVKPVENKKLIEGAIKGMLAALDPHSGYLDPDFYNDLQAQTRGEFGGLGIEITMKDGLLVVVSPMEGSPAEAAGVQAGDAIVKIEGEFTKDYTLFDAVKKLRGPKGTTINISVMRKNVSDFIDIAIVRDQIVVKTVKKRYLGDGFGYVRINQFVEKTADDLEAALKFLNKKSAKPGLKGLIIDLRNNPGGLLTQAIRVSDLFLKDGMIVYTDGRIEGQKHKYYAQPQDTELNYPIIVMVNGGSASASEIVAGSLKDHGRALILGEQTFGKGSVQTITGLDNGGALTLTTALYYTKSGRSIQAMGVSPDITIDPAEELAQEEEGKKKEKIRRGRRVRERDLPRAISNPTSSRGGQKKDNDDKDEEPQELLSDNSKVDPEKIELQDWLKQDAYMRRAYELLRTFNIFVKSKKGADQLLSGKNVHVAERIDSQPSF